MTINSSSIRLIASMAILIVALFVVLSPGAVYAPAPRIILFFLCSMLPPILLGAEATDRFKLQAAGFMLSVGGGAAVCFGALYLLYTFSKPEQQIAIFDIYNEQGSEVDLEVDGAFSVSPAGAGGLTPTVFASQNHLVFIFPEQLASAVVSVKKTSGGKPYVGTFSYSGNRSYRKELKPNFTIESGANP